MRNESRTSENRKRNNRHARPYEPIVMRYNRNLSTELTSMQHTALMILCRYRHKLHAVSENYSALSEYDRQDIRTFFLNKIEPLLRSAGLPALNIRFFPIELSETDAGRYLYIENMNAQIERYLSSVDKKYSTMYCPTGFLRAKRKKLHDAARI